MTEIQLNLGGPEKPPIPTFEAVPPSNNPLVQEGLELNRHHLTVRESAQSVPYGVNPEFQVVGTPTFVQEPIAGAYVVPPPGTGPVEHFPSLQVTESNPPPQIAFNSQFAIRERQQIAPPPEFQTGYVQPAPEQFPSPSASDDKFSKNPEVIAGHELTTNKDGSLVIKNPDGTIWVRSEKPNDPGDLQTANQPEHPTYTFHKYQLGVRNANEKPSPDGVPANFIETGYFKGSVQIEGDKLAVSQVYPVPQKWLYSSDGSSVHQFKNGVTEELTAGGLKETYPDGQSRTIPAQGFGSFTSSRGDLNVDGDYNFGRTPQNAQQVGAIQPSTNGEFQQRPQAQPGAGEVVTPPTPLSNGETVVPPTLPISGRIQDIPLKQTEFPV